MFFVPLAIDKTFQMTRFKEILPKVLPTGAALLLFFIVSALYFAPQFRGEVLPQQTCSNTKAWPRRSGTTVPKRAKIPSGRGGCSAACPPT